MGTMPGSSKESKLERSLDLIKQASDDGCKIILNGELCTMDYDSLYTLDRSNFSLAESIPGHSTRAVGELTKEYKNYVIFPIFEKKISGIYYNSAPVVGPEGEVVGLYRKTHLASAGVLERLYFRSGQKFQSWETDFYPHAKFGNIICFDRRHPEPARILATMGTEIMFCPTAAMDYAAGEVQWEAVNRIRALDAGMFCVYSNRSGREIENEYIGESMIVNPHGEVITKAGKEKDIVITATIDLGEVDSARNDHPILREMRNDLYSCYYSDPKFDELL